MEQVRELALFVRNFFGNDVETEEVKLVCERVQQKSLFPDVLQELGKLGISPTV